MLPLRAIELLPLDLRRWDRAPGGDALVVCLWADVRPLRGAAGLLDWRLNGRLSSWLRGGRIDGRAGEKLLFPTARVPWRHVLAIGLGETGSFSEDAFRAGVATALETARGLGLRAVGIAPPGRDLDRITPERALRVLLSVSERDEEERGGPALGALTLIDTPHALRAMSETLRAIERSLDH